MPINTGHWKVQRRSQQHIYHHCQLISIAPAHVLLVSVCVFMLPMLALVDEHVQPATMFHINNWHVQEYHITFSHTPLLLPSLKNLLPAMVLQTNVASLTIKCPSDTLFRFIVSPVFLDLCLNFLPGIVLLALLLLLSGDIETNPGPVVRTVQNLRSLHSKLHPVADKWYSLGVQLQVPIESLKCIRNENLPMTERLLEMLTVWLKCTNPPPTWDSLTEALDSPPVGEWLLAQQLRNKYCSRKEEVTYGYTNQGPSLPPTLATSQEPLDKQESSLLQVHTWTTPSLPLIHSQVTPDPAPSKLPLSSVSTSTTYQLSSTSTTASSQDCSPFPNSEYHILPHKMPLTPQPATITTPLQEHSVLQEKESVKQHISQLQTRFRDLVIYTYRMLLHECVDIRSFRSSLLALDVFRKDEHQEFINKHLMKINPETTFDDLWAKLSKYWNFLNFDLLEHVVSIFGSEDLKLKMKSYEHDLQSFRKATKLCDFIDCWPVRGQTPPERELREFVAKMGHHWDNCSLEDLDTSEGAITRKFFLPKYALQDLLTRLATHLPTPSSVRSSSHGSCSLSSGCSSRSLSCASSCLTTSGYFSKNSSPGYCSWCSKLETAVQEPPVREKRVDEMSQQLELLPEQYLSNAEVDEDPTLPTRYKNYLSSTPAIRAASYTTFNAKMSADVFTWSQHTESTLPATVTELFTAFTLKTLVDHLSTHPLYQKHQLKVTTFSDLPADVYKQFQGLCRMAYEGILNRQYLVFSVAPLGLMQEVPQMYTEGRASSYRFIHLTLQEYLAAIHISQFPLHAQIKLVQEHLDGGNFKMTVRFLAGLTRLSNIVVPPSVTRFEKDDTKLAYFQFLFEAKDISVTTRTLGSDEINVKPHYSWTPLDYFVTGHAISHSNCPWILNFFISSIDDEKFELFCQGCAAPGGTGCMGHILHADFSGNDITSKSIQSFVHITHSIIQNMKELFLNCNKLDGSACDLLAKAVPSMCKLVNLSLSSNPIGSGGAVEVIKALCGSGVEQLQLCNTGIGKPDCEAVCELLKSSHSLQHLSISQNNLSSDSVASIITGLSHNSSLTTLNISNSHFSMANVNNLASILGDQSKCILTWLWLQDCCITGRGASELAAALYKNICLTHLNLDRNPVGVEGASSMSDMLQHNTSLKYVNLHDESVEEEGVRQLIKSLKHNQTLKELWLPVKYKSETSDHRITWRCSQGATCTTQ